VTLLERIRSPRDLKDLSAEDLPQLAAEIRDVLIGVVTKNGGHLGPNLGVVELTIALHRVFDSPVDRILFDTGHQSYVHKLLTGRYPRFDTLRQGGGLAGYPNRASTTWSRTRTPRPACPMPTGSRRPTSSGVSGTAASWR